MKSQLSERLTLLANIGVIAGIIFLALEIRQNTEVARSAVDLDIANMSTDFHMRVAENPSLAHVVMVGRSDPSKLSEEEKVQYEYHVTAVFLLMQGAYKQYRRGYLLSDGWEPYKGLIRYFMDNTLAREWWINGSTVFSPEFEAVVTEISGVARNYRN